MMKIMPNRPMGWGIPLSLGGVYMIKNTKNGKFYIGSSVSVANRFSKHLSDLRKGLSGCRRLAAAWKHHGEMAFEFLLLEEVEDRSQLVVREQHYLDTLSPEYNIMKKAYSAMGNRHTEESRRKMSISRAGKGNAMYGRFGKDHPAFGTNISEERKSALSKAHSGSGNPMYGVTPKHAKLSPDQVKMVREMIASGISYKEITKAIPGLTTLNVSQIKCGRAYKGVGLEHPI